MNAVNDSIQESHWVARRVAFEIMSRLPIIASELPKQKDLAEIIPKAQMKLYAKTAKKKTPSALKWKISQYADRIIRIGGKALPQSEIHSYWIGLFIVVHVDRRMITVKPLDRCCKFLLNSFHIKPFFK